MYDNYVQALKNLASIPEQLDEAMHVLKIPSIATFEAWWLEEKAYLQGLKSEPEGEVLTMEYVETLAKLNTAEDV
jgi:hypothetical protein